jgi:hypothetical protein
LAQKESPRAGGQGRTGFTQPPGPDFRLEPPAVSGADLLYTRETPRRPLPAGPGSWSGRRGCRGPSWSSA